MGVAKANALAGLFAFAGEPNVNPWGCAACPKAGVCVAPPNGELCAPVCAAWPKPGLPTVWLGGEENPPKPPRGLLAPKAGAAVVVGEPNNDEVGAVVLAADPNENEELAPNAGALLVGLLKLNGLFSVVAAAPKVGFAASPLPKEKPVFADPNTDLLSPVPPNEKPVEGVAVPNVPAEVVAGDPNNDMISNRVQILTHKYLTRVLFKNILAMV